MKTLVGALLVVFVLVASLQAQEAQPRWYGIVLIDASIKPDTKPEFQTWFNGVVARARARGLQFRIVRFNVTELSKRPLRKGGRPTVATYDTLTCSMRLSVAANAQPIYETHADMLLIRRNPNFLKGQISVRFHTQAPIPEAPRAARRRRSR